MAETISIKKNTIANYIGQFYNMFIGIFMLPLYLKYLGAEAYGLVGFFAMFMSIIMILDIGLTSTLTREIAKSKVNIDKFLSFKNLLRSVEIIIIVLSVILFIFFFIFADWIALNWLKVQKLSLDGVSYCIVLMGGMSGFRWLSALYGGCINGLEKQVWLNNYKMLFATFRFIGAFVLIKYITNDVRHFFEYQMLLSILEFLIVALKLYKTLPSSGKITPSYYEIKKILPFALSIAYTSSIWIILTQIDKLMLSHFLSLEEYGYFALVVLVANAIMQFSNPIYQAIIPRMTVLVAENKYDEMKVLYKKATQFAGIISFSVAGTVAVFGTELLYAWTGNIKAAKYAGPILFWYVLGNAILTIVAFQYYLQYAYGNLKYHIKGNSIFGLFQIIFMFLAIYFYGAIGAGVAWFLLQLFFFIFWTYYIHNIYVPGLHKNWLSEDVFPLVLSTSLVLCFLYILGFDILIYDRLVQFLILLVIGSEVLIINMFVSSEGRMEIYRILRKVKND